MLYIIFRILIMGSSFLALNVQFGGSFQNFWEIFQDRGKKISIGWNISQLTYPSLSKTFHFDIDIY